MKLQILSLAEADLLKGFAFYEEQEQGLGAYFLDQLCADIDSLHASAGIHLQVAGFHRLLSSRFPYAIYYRHYGKTIFVWRVLDLRRNPRWITRQLRRSGRKS